MPVEGEIVCGILAVVLESERGHELYEGREGRHRGRWRRGRSETEAEAGDKA